MFGANKTQKASSRSSLTVSGLQMLLQAHEYAHELKRDAWDFAVELPALQKAGLSSSDLRWLLCKGYADHARETTSGSDAARSFQHQEHLALWKRSCFVLTTSGVDFVQESVVQVDTEDMSDYSSMPMGDTNGQGGTNGELNGSAARTSDCKSMTPTWDCDRQELRLGHQVVKEFKLRSPNQVTILTAFEEEGWPQKIDDPLSPHGEIDAKQRLRDTIKSLNRNQKCGLIRFRGDGTGQGIRWELRRMTSQKSHLAGDQTSDFQSLPPESI